MERVTELIINMENKKAGKVKTMGIIKEIRTLSTESIRNLCIKMNWYTKGTCAEYDELLRMCDRENVTVKEVHAIALNIMEHSADTERPLTAYMYEVGKCISTYYEETETEEIGKTMSVVDQTELLKECCEELYAQAEYLGECMAEKELSPNEKNITRHKRARSNLRGKKEIFRILCKHLNEDTTKYFDICDNMREESYSLAIEKKMQNK